MTRYLVRRGNVLLFVVLGAILLLIGAVTWERFNATKSAREYAQHTTEVISTIKDLGVSVRDAETGQRVTC
jgi:CHASE3 domain sensor protein